MCKFTMKITRALGNASAPLLVLHGETLPGNKNTAILGRVTYNFYSSCKNMHLSFKNVYAIQNMGE